MTAHLRPVELIDTDSLPEYPIPDDARLDHRFVMWESSRWMASDMRWNGSAEAKCYFFELVNIAYSETPVGTLPRDTRRLARMVQPQISESHFERLCTAEFGPLHGWVPCRVGDAVRLMHPVLTRIVLGAFASRASFLAASDAASTAKRLKRLTADVAQLAPRLALDPRKVRFIDEVIRKAIEDRGGERRLPRDLHEGIQACVQAERAGRFPENLLR